MWTKDGAAAWTPRLASGALITLAEARERLLAGVTAVEPTRLTLDDAIGVALASNIVAPTDLPASTIGLRDGWAVAAEAVAGASPYTPILLQEAPIWVEAGDTLPADTDTVLVPDAVPDPAAAAGRIRVIEEAPEAEGTRAAGADLRRGAVLAKAGTRLTIQQALTIAACGIGHIDARRPAVRLIATGPAGVALCAALALRLEAEGARVEDVVAVTGEAEAMAEALLAGAAVAVFVVGGSGFGRRDTSAAALALAGRVTAHGIALRPGETTGFGLAAGRPVLLMPGRPDAVLAAYLVLGRPLLSVLAGADALERPKALLLRKIVSALGTSDLVFVRRDAEGIEPLGGAEIPLHRLGLADAAVLVPPEREGYGEGTMVEIIPL